MVFLLPPPGCLKLWRKIKVMAKALFKHINVSTPQEAKTVLRDNKGNTDIIAGGTDLIGRIKDNIYARNPEVLVNIKTIDGLEYIKEQDGILKIGALTRIEDIARNEIIKNKYSALAEAAQNLASPAIRQMGTIGGNICQSVRCWYYWVPSNRFDCIRKGGKICNAFLGDNRYHSIFGAARIANTPCTSNCPGNIEIPDYMSKIRTGNINEAAEILMERNPLPAITGRVCPHPCESGCNRGEFDEAVSINAVERYLGDYILENADQFYRPPQMDTGKKVAIIGSGPAGMAAAYYLRKAGHGVTIFDKYEEAGGMLRYGIPAYRLPKDIVRKQVDALKLMNIEFKMRHEIGKDSSVKELKKKYDCIFMAIGAWVQPGLDIEGFQLAEFGLDFLHNINLGERENPGKRVVVIGGGNVAVDVAVSARRLGAEKVTMVCLESRDEMPAISEDLEQASKEGIELMPCWGPSRIIQKNNRISGIELIKCTSVFDDNGNFAPSFDSCVMEKLEADQVIMAIGQKPDLSFIHFPLEQERGWIKADEDTQATGAQGIFAGGDMTGTKPTVIGSIAAGRRAAIAINNYCIGTKKDISRRNVDNEQPLTFSDDCFKTTSRATGSQRNLTERKIDIEDVFGIDVDRVRLEADRCFNCGCVAVNNSDLAPALIALNARVKTTRRIVPAESFFSFGKNSTTVLKDDEVVTEIQVPLPANGTKSKFIKFSLRKSIDYPIINCAAVIQNEKGKVKAARICLNAVFSTPYRAVTAEKAIINKSIDEKIAEIAGEQAVKDICPVPASKYKVQIARTLVTRVILACKTTEG